MKKCLRTLGIVFVGLVVVFIISCDEGIDTAIDMMPPEPGGVPTQPGTYQSYTFQGYLDHNSSIWAVAFDSGNPETILYSLGDDSIKVWNTDTKQLKETIPVNPGSSIVDWPDSTQQPIGGPASYTTYGINPGHTSVIRSVASDGRLVAFGSSDKTFSVWDRNTGAFKFSETLPGQVWAVALGGGILASGGGFEGIYLWDANTGVHKGTLKANTSQVESIAFYSNLLVVATGKGDGEAIHVWDLNTNLLLDTLTVEEGYTIRKVAISRDGRTIAGGAYFPQGPGVLLWKRNL